ncbi:MAG: serine protease [Deltaproteobacteria bacterium CG_4_8_14_3_um_filter_51_11]|nr:nodulation protein NfeD [bacterium]PIP45531.1 MAG: serine protease [Deltaproteobacteria bacterium CG23_combo_of_CG06-09_8_20_14_all_51_20]PIW01863.1 MAG: serine protease [Deltaproteobacteria bacterium CG17_big_fil_post_rev_8_21_14_2_50_51_6]PIX20659.1 MAG: serine protease [Deltaproteobacteria bacterium CG_4_8_14_3_um_filter_51_11]PIY26665.1 MAG: serine protease [Deltaproteobacteria bacterium CG_4_10_14_3_um_filter_51_14]PJB39413.1 MAG: serine protease [Deltaproteobacteria bacterium CG_4_9_1
MTVADKPVLSVMIRFSAALLFWFVLAGGVYAAEPFALVIELEGPISPGTASYLERGIEDAGERGAEAAVIRMDTPGGLVSSMRTMIKVIMNADVPVVVYVGPRGAGAASAGVMITVAAHVAAMAPGTNIGAAHPVGAGGKDIEKTMAEKVVNDMASYARGIAEMRGRNGEWVEKAIRESVSITSEEALEKKVVDLIAEDLKDLMRLLDGREVTTNSGKRVLKTAGITLKYYELGFRDRILKIISDPSIAYILMMIGLAGLYFELSNPGAVFPGVIGAISLILAFYSMQTLPVNYAGLLLIALAVILFIAEIKITSYGLLSVAGIISLGLGSVMLFEDLGVPLRLIVPIVLVVGGFFAVVAGLAFRAYMSKPMAGAEGIVGETGIVKEDIDPEGVVFAHGERWRAVSPEKISKGDKVIVEKIEGLILTVKRLNNV